jgi:hypothetical protein
MTNIIHGKAAGLWTAIGTTPTVAIWSHGIVAAEVSSIVDVIVRSSDTVRTGEPSAVGLIKAIRPPAGET